MNMKTTKFLAVLAVFAMAFAGLAVAAEASNNDAGTATVVALPGATITEAGSYFVPSSHNATITINAPGLEVYLYFQNGNSNNNCAVTITAVGKLIFRATTATTVGEISYVDGLDINPVYGDSWSAVKVNTGAFTSSEVSTQWISTGKAATGTDNVYTMATFASPTYTFYPDETGSILTGTTTTYLFNGASLSIQDDATSITSLVEIEEFVGEITTTSGVPAISKWTSGDVIVKKGAETTVSAAVTTSGDLTIYNGATVTADGGDLVFNGALNLYGTLESDDSITIAGAFSNVDSESKKGTLTMDGASKTLTIKSNVTYYGKLSFTKEATISIDSGKTFYVINEPEITDSTAAIGVSGKTLTIDGKGTMNVRVINQVRNDPNGQSVATGITAETLTITSNLTVTANGTSVAKSDNAYGMGLRGETLTIGPSEKPTSLANVNVTANDRAIDIYDDNDLKIQYVKGAFIGGEYGIRTISTLTLNGAEISAEIGTPKDNSLGNTFGDGHSGIKADGKITVDKGSKLTAESILAEAGMEIKGDSSVKLKYDAGAAISNGAKWTGTAGSFNAVEAIKGMCGLFAGTYKTVTKTTTVTDLSGLITVGTVDIEKGSTLALEPGCGIIANVEDKNTTTNKIAFNASKGTSGSTSGDAYSIVAVPMTAGGSSDLILGIGSVVMNGFTIIGPASNYEVTEGKITVYGEIELYGEIDVDIEMDTASTPKASILVPAGTTLTFDDIEITGNENNSIKILGEVAGKASATNTIKTTATNPKSAGDVISGPTITEDADMAFYKLTGTGETDTANINYLLTKYAYVGIVANGKTLTIDKTDLIVPKNVTLYLGVAEVTSGGSDISGTLPKTAASSAYKAKTAAMTAGAEVAITVPVTTVGTTTTTYEMEVTGAKVYDVSTDLKSTITVYGTLSLDAADVCTIVDVKTNGYVSIKNPLKLNATGTPTSDLRVGYGNTLTMDAVTVSSGKNVYAYGTLKIDGATTVQYGGKIITYKGSSVSVDGTLSVEGTVKTAGYTAVNGKVTIYRAAGSASWENTGYITVFADATFDVSKGKQSGANANTLTSSTVGGFTLYGTTTVTGTFAGQMIDYGTLTFNGVSNGATVYLRSGVTAYLVSVEGTLTVDDSDAACVDTRDADTGKYKDYVLVYDGNSFAFNNVKGITVAEVVEETAGSITVDEVTVPVKYYVSTLGITGTASSAVKDDTNSVTAAGGSIQTTKYKSKWSSSVDEGSAAIGDFTLGKKSVLAFSGNDNITVIGTVVAIAEDARIQWNNGGLNVTVTGAICANDDNGYRLIPDNYTMTLSDNTHMPIAGFAGKVNATYYYYDDESGNTNYVLTTFNAALEQVLTADEDTIYVFGSQTISADATIPDGGNVVEHSSGTITIGKKATVTISEDAVVDTSAGVLKVTGVLVVMDKDTGLKYSTNTDNFVYQVKTENGNVVTYAGIEGALARSVSGDVITMSQSGTISSDAIIPEGVKLIVPAKIELSLGSKSKEVTLTVNGQLQILRNGEISKVASSKDVTVIVNGSILLDNAAIYDDADKFEMTNFVTFEMKIDGRDTGVLSNLKFAADNCTSGLVTVYGAVSADEATFTPAKDKEILIWVPVSYESDVINAMAVGKLTLEGKTTLDVDATIMYHDGIFNGTVVSGSALGPVEVLFVDATGFTLQANTVETAIGEVDHTYLYANLFDGRIAIMEGTVEIDVFTIEGVAIDDHAYLANYPSTTSSLYVGPDSFVIVATGSFLGISDDMDANYEEPMAIIDGTVTVLGVMEVEGYTVVGGDFYVMREKSTGQGTVSVTGVIDIDGDLVISDDKTLYGTFLITGSGAIMNVGAENYTAAGATVTGPVTVTEAAFINVYPGSDITEAKINWDIATDSSKAIYTDVYVEDTLYVTTFTNAGASVKLVESAITKDDVIPGLDIRGSITATKDSDTSLYKYWFIDDDATQNLKVGRAYVGAFEAVYFYPAASYVYGTVTVGTGIDLFVDGKNYEPQSYYGKEDKFTVGAHTVYVQIKSGYTGDDVTIKFNGVVVPTTATGGVFLITADMDTFLLVADGATPYTPEPTPEPEKESEWTITTILLCVLVVLIAIMAVIVALRLNRN